MNEFPVGVGETLGILVEDDLGQILAEDRCIAGTTGMDFGQVHDFHLVVVAEEAAVSAPARKQDAALDVLVEVTQHHHRFDQEDRLADPGLGAGQIAADPVFRLPLGFDDRTLAGFFVFEFVGIELPCVIDQ